MATVPLELYKLFEEELGKEKAERAIELVKEILNTVEKKAREQKTIVKSELKDELRKELATKEDIAILDQKLETVYRELDQKIETVRQEIRTSEERIKKWLFLLMFLIIFLNQNSTTFFLKVIGLLK